MSYYVTMNGEYPVRHEEWFGMTLEEVIRACNDDVKRGRCSYYKVETPYGVLEYHSDN
jgi:hypothetical protein